jgi:hypothetical protein
MKTYHSDKSQICCISSPSNEASEHTWCMATHNHHDINIFTPPIQQINASIQLLLKTKLPSNINIFVTFTMPMTLSQCMITVKMNRILPFAYSLCLQVCTTSDQPQVVNNHQDRCGDYWWQNTKVVLQIPLARMNTAIPGESTSMPWTWNIMF